MQVRQSAISLNVADVDASSAFAKRHFGFTEAATFKPERMKGQRADGLLIVFVVDDVDAQYERLQRQGVTILTPIETEASSP